MALRMNRLFGRSEEVTIDNEIVSVGVRMGLANTSSLHGVDLTALMGRTANLCPCSDKVDDGGDRFDLMSHLNFPSTSASACFVTAGPHGMRTIGNDQRIVCQLGQSDRRGFLAARRARRDQKELFIDDRDGLERRLIRRASRSQGAVDPAGVELVPKYRAR